MEAPPRGDGAYDGGRDADDAMGQDDNALFNSFNKQPMLEDPGAANRERVAGEEALSDDDDMMPAAGPSAPALSREDSWGEEQPPESVASLPGVNRPADAAAQRNAQAIQGRATEERRPGEDVKDDVMRRVKETLDQRPDPPVTPSLPELRRGPSSSGGGAGPSSSAGAAGPSGAQGPPPPASGAFDVGAERAVLVVCGGTHHTRWEGLPEDLAKVAEARLKKLETAYTKANPDQDEMPAEEKAKAQATIASWVAEGFTQALPGYKCVARSLDGRERAALQAARQEEEAILSRPYNPLSALPRSRADETEGDVFSRLSERTGPSVTGAYLRDEYEAFMHEERRSIIRVLKKARAKGISPEEAEEAVKQEDEATYMQALLLEETVSSECFESRSFENTKPAPYRAKTTPEDAKAFERRLKEYIRKQDERGGQTPGGGKAGKRDVQGAAKPIGDLREKNQCEPCDEWPFPSKPWEETDRVAAHLLVTQEYKIAVARLMDLRDELNIAQRDGGKRPWEGTSRQTAFEKDPLAKQVPEKGTDGKAIDFVDKGGNVLKPTQGKRWLLDMIIAKYQASSDVGKQEGGGYTGYLATDMLLCFPVMKRECEGGQCQLNRLIDFLCWYNQHITLPAGMDKLAKRQLFYQAMCAPTVISDGKRPKDEAKAAKKKEAKEAKGAKEKEKPKARARPKKAKRLESDDEDGDEEPEQDDDEEMADAVPDNGPEAWIERGRELYYKISNKYDRIQKAAEAGFKNLYEDLQQGNASLLKRYGGDEAYFRAAMQLYNPK